MTENPTPAPESVAPPDSPAAGQGHPVRVVLILLALGLLVVAAAWGWSAYQVSKARDELAANRLKGAWEHLEKARRTWPVGTDTHLLSAHVARRLGLDREASNHLEAHERLGGDRALAPLERTLLLVQDGELAGEDQELLRLVRGDHSESAAILEALARGYMKVNHTAGLDQVVRLWPDRLVTSCWRGKAHHRLGHFNEAIADLTPFVVEDPDCDEARLDLAQANYRLGRLAESLMHYRHLHRRDPSSTEVLLGLGTCLQDHGELNEAAAVFDRLLEQVPNHPATLVERGRVAFRQGKPQQGESLARRVIASHPGAPDAYLVLSLCLEAQGNKAAAREQHQRWQTLDAAHYHLGLILPQLGRSPRDVLLRYQAGSSFLRLGDRKMAKEVLDQALALEPGHRPTHLLLAEYYTGLGQHQLAREHQQRATAP